MDLQADIKWIVSEITKVKDPELISVFKSLLKYRAKHNRDDWWDQATNDEKAEIERAINGVEAGDFVSHNEVMTNARKCLQK